MIPAGASAVMTVRFAPSALWARSTRLRIYSNDGDEDPFELALSGTGVHPAGLLNEALENAGLAELDATPAATPFGDGVENILKYAFNLDLSGPDNRAMKKDGSSGLPGGGWVDGTASFMARSADGGIENGNQKHWRIQFVRKKRSGLVYAAKKSTTLEAGSFVVLTGEETVEDIDEEWERVSILEPVDPTIDKRFFTKVEVVLP